MSHQAPLIVISGPESTGKTTLAVELSRLLAWPLVTEVARSLLEEQGSVYSEADVYRMAVRQWQHQQSVRRSGLPTLADTDLLTYRIWLEERFGRCSPWIEALHRRARPAHYLLCVPDIQWEPDPLRENPHDRDRLLDRHLEILRSEGMSFDLIRGVGEERFLQARTCLRHLGI
ncbi:MAG: ATP-binding protein [Chitinophagales bacterium]|nr:ATP-binding protein [Chitinophagales bacterium]